MERGTAIDGQRLGVKLRLRLALPALIGLALLFLSSVVAVGQSSGPTDSSKTPGRANKPWSLVFETRVETSEASRVWVPLRSQAVWDPARTAVIVCDTWDYHHSINAVRRLSQLAPRMNQFVGQARSDGATIIHAPSDCMATYERHPARRRAIEIAGTIQEEPPPQADDWNHGLPSEKLGDYPVDQSDGGEDDDPVEHAAWAKQLERLGRNPAAPWKAQSALVEIDAERDLITDRGGEIWKILQSRGIDQVLLVGVHTNMCVLGRPFGLRQLKLWGKQVALVSDLTDTMYNPARWPYVSHFAGTDLVIEYIQQHVCPTVTSEQFLGDKPFRFGLDRRPTLALLISEDEYQTRQTLQEFVQSEQLRDEFRIVFLHGQDESPGKFIDLSPLESADILLVSVRRLPLPLEQLEALKRFIHSGKPIIGIRTANHAFIPREPADPPAGWGWWPEFDAEVIGGNYTGHYGNEVRPKVSRAASGDSHADALLQGCDFSQYESAGSLYRTRPLSPAAAVILEGKIAEADAEPVAWTYVRADGGRTFYTSLGHPEDFVQPAFRRLLLNAVRWGAGMAPRGDSPNARGETSHWETLHWPSEPAGESLGVESEAFLWLRCFVKFRQGAPKVGGEFNLGAIGVDAAIWLNGVALPMKERNGVRFASVSPDQWCQDDANTVVIRLPVHSWKGSARLVPTLSVARSGWRLEGKWQKRLGSTDEDWSQFPIPPRFGGSADIVFQF
jgi:type 1 glutamine amidotransferase/nicotinamidase-related amidase